MTRSQRNRSKTSLFLLISGLSLAWFGGMAAVMVTWGGFGVPAVFVGVALALAGIFLGLSAHRADAQASKTTTQLPHHDRTALAFGLALSLHLLMTAAWYATSSTGPLNPGPNWIRLRAYSPYVDIVCCGFLMGVLVKDRLPLNTLLLALFLAIVSGTLHWMAASIGIRVDWPTAQGAAMMALLSLLFVVPLAALGSAVGLGARRLAQYVVQPGRTNTRED